MPLEFRKNRDGSLRNVWFGRFEVDGKRFCPNLGVKIAGTPPASLLDEGDAAFERSRAAAQAKLDSIVEEARTKQGSERLVEKLYEIKTGERIKSVPLADLPDEWTTIPRKRKPDDRYAAQCRSTLTRFAEYVRQHNGKAEEIAHVTRTVARAFMDAEAKRGVTAKTWNDTLKLLRATFKHLLPAGAINPFSDTPTKETDTVFRKPFSPEELKAIVDVARDDEFIRPILVTGICTAMRRGDCCLLEWRDVDLEKRFVTVKTSKTGQTVSIPIFPMLYDELKALALAPPGTAAKSDKRDSTPHPTPLPGRGGEGGRRNGYVFPEQARMYSENPDGITWRVKKILAVALGEPVEVDDSEMALPEVSADEARRRGEEHIAKLPQGEKKQRMALVFKFYMEGKSICDAMEEAEVSKGSASGYLHEIEAAIGCRVVRNQVAGQSMAARLRADTGLLWVKREGGTRRASVRDFHSFRVTWVTLALTAGVPLELVQKVTGHKTTDIVLKHYFQPGREAFRQALHAAMPKLLTNGQKAPKDEMLEIVNGLKANTLKRDKARLLELLKAA